MRPRVSAALLALAAMWCWAASAQAAGDPAAGKVAFGQCASCHASEVGQTRLGPTLFGVVGRAAGAVPGYSYSAAMARSGLTWTTATLDRFIAAPRAVVPGTKMAYVGLADPAMRSNLIAYLATLK